MLPKQNEIRLKIQIGGEEQNKGNNGKGWDRVGAGEESIVT